MKTTTLLGLLPLLFVAPPALAVQAAASVVDEHAEQQATYRRNHAEKIAKDFVSYGGWMLDWDQARERARAEKKMLFIYFTRSYAG